MYFPGMDNAKRYFGEKVLNQLLGYLENDPIEKLPRILDLASKVAVLPDHREKIETLREQLEENSVYQQYTAKMLTELDHNFKSKFLFNLFVNASMLGVPRQRRKSEEMGVGVPFTILIDPTSNCNLRCKGCWAGAYQKHNSLSFEQVDKLVTEAKELGIYFIAMSGGEPFLWPHLFELINKHDDVAFMLYTNGTFINEEVAEKMRAAGNITVAISLEGDRDATDARRGSGVFDKVMQAMDNLRNKGVGFGISLTVTGQNCEDIYSDQFIDLMIEKGALYGWSFHYIPIGSNPDFEMMLKPEQRLALVDRVKHIRTTKQIQIADFWNDGSLTHGCIAGGRRYFHITAKGDVEPCAFVHFAVDTIHGKSLVEILHNPVFKAYQERQPFSDNLLRPCPLIDVPEALREIVNESGASPTHEGADSVLYGDHAAAMDYIAAAWRAKANPKWKDLNTGERHTVKV